MLQSTFGGRKKGEERSAARSPSVRPHWRRKEGIGALSATNDAAWESRKVAHTSWATVAACAATGGLPTGWHET